MGGHDHLGFPQLGSRLKQLGDELKPSRVNAVLGFLQSDKRRRFRGPRQGQKSQDAQCTFGYDPSRDQRISLAQAKLDLAQAVDLDMDSSNRWNHHVKCFFHGSKLSFVQGAKGVQESGELLASQPDVMHFLHRICRTHPLARLEIEGKPALEFLAQGDKVWMVRRIERPRKEGMVQKTLMVGRVSLALHPQMNTVLNPFQKGPTLAGRLPFGVQGGRVLVGDRKIPEPGKISTSTR